MPYWKEKKKAPPSVEHLIYFKIWAIANTISSGILILILLCLIAFMLQAAYNMSYKRITLKYLLNYPNIHQNINRGQRQDATYQNVYKVDINNKSTTNI